jgi:hypothetical protein
MRRQQLREHLQRVRPVAASSDGEGGGAQLGVFCWEMGYSGKLINTLSFTGFMFSPSGQLEEGR